MPRPRASSTPADARRKQLGTGEVRPRDPNAGPAGQQAHEFLALFSRIRNSSRALALASVLLILDAPVELDDTWSSGHAKSMRATSRPRVVPNLQLRLGDRQPVPMDHEPESILAHRFQSAVSHPYDECSR
jgi:hypothetical protein